MKHAFAFLALSLLLTACGRNDARLQRQVTGTWVVEVGNNIRSVNLIRPDGSYAAKVTGFTNGSVVMIEGTFRVKNGELIETVTKSSQTNEKVPFTVHGKIIRLNEHEIVAKWDTKPVSVVVVARKVQN
jgi:hypothetical protein